MPAGGSSAWAESRASVLQGKTRLLALAHPENHVEANRYAG